MLKRILSRALRLALPAVMITVGIGGAVQASDVAVRYWIAKSRSSEVHFTEYCGADHPSELAPGGGFAVASLHTWVGPRDVAAPRNLAAGDVAITSPGVSCYQYLNLYETFDTGSGPGRAWAPLVTEGTPLYTCITAANTTTCRPKITDSAAGRFDWYATGTCSNVYIQDGPSADACSVMHVSGMFGGVVLADQAWWRGFGPW